MVLRVVADGEHAPAGDGAGLTEHLEELPEGLPVESSSLTLKQELAIAQTDGSKVSTLFRVGW
jgi:hypothetical protein